MQRLAAARGYIERDRLRDAFSHLIISDELLEQLGPAVNANKAIFLYGPPGNGKTVVADGMGGDGRRHVHAARLDVDGAVVTMYDPIAHETLEREDGVSACSPRRRAIAAGSGSAAGGRRRRRADAVDARPDVQPRSKFYEAPVQLKANGGVLLVDDFGRQRMRPRDLLNRWIVPLESRIDFLTLHTGKKFQVPFDVLWSFATNLDPASLADEAFLRRIPYKIPIERSDAGPVRADLRAEPAAAAETAVRPRHAARTCTDHHMRAVSRHGLLAAVPDRAT
jgi:hypothetical protein